MTSFRIWSIQERRPGHHDLAAANVQKDTAEIFSPSLVKAAQAESPPPFNADLFFENRLRFRQDQINFGKSQFSCLYSNAILPNPLSVWGGLPLLSQN
jgi:hypothetical protein